MAQRYDTVRDADYAAGFAVGRQDGFLGRVYGLIGSSRSRDWIRGYRAGFYGSAV